MLFAPPTEHWTPLSPRYTPLRRLDTFLGWGFLAVLVAAPVFIFAGWRWGLGAVGIALIVISWRMWRQAAIAGSWGFAERETDLYIKSGIFFRRLTVVPYGRMQAVEVAAGPLQRAFKVTTVKLVTASAASDAVIPGLDPADAAALRDRLTERGETQAAGL